MSSLKDWPLVNTTAYGATIALDPLTGKLKLSSSVGCASSSHLESCTFRLSAWDQCRELVQVTRVYGMSIHTVIGIPRASMRRRSSQYCTIVSCSSLDSLASTWLTYGMQKSSSGGRSCWRERVAVIIDLISVIAEPECHDNSASGRQFACWVQKMHVDSGRLHASCIQWVQRTKHGKELYVK